MAPEVKNQMMEKYANTLLVGHVGQPDSVAEAYLFLMKSVTVQFPSLKVTNHVIIYRCDFITGERIEVDGGSKLS